MLPQEIIRKKRDGGSLDETEIAAVVAGLVDGGFSDAQVAAFAMAVYFQGLSRDELVALTRAMTESGERLSWEALDLGGPVLDKHSTGGVGDKVSLMLAPIVAAAGGFVPMISGRGLGHTGGTLDKLQAIPGYDVAPDPAVFRATVKRVGCAIIGQTASLAPADGRFYAVRDVTATVESIPLITASILSKKLAAGLDALVMDVKTGRGAFAADLDEARALARSIVEVAGGAGLPARALITDMDQVLGRSVGNALEVIEAVDYLTGAARDPRLHAVTLALAGELLCLGGLASDPAAGSAKADALLQSGAAAEVFAAMVVALGGPGDLLTKAAARLPRAPVVRAVAPARAGIVQAMDTRAIGIALVALGGGRTGAGDRIDPAVGFSEVAGVGEAVDGDHPLALVHAASEADAEAATATLRQAVTLGQTKTQPGPVVIEVVSDGDE